MKRETDVLNGHERAHRRPTKQGRKEKENTYCCCWGVPSICKAPILSVRIETTWYVAAIISYQVWHYSVSHPPTCTTTLSVDQSPTFPKRRRARFRLRSWYTHGCSIVHTTLVYQYSTATYGIVLYIHVASCDSLAFVSVGQCTVLTLVVDLTKTKSLPKDKMA